MPRRIALLVLACLSALVPATELRSEPGPASPRGHLVLVGGGGTTQAIVAATLALCGDDPAVVVLPQASGRDDRGEASTAMWREAGAASVTNVESLASAAAREAIAEADLLWMPGGVQSRLLDALVEAGASDLIAEHYRRGGVVGGTSAGAAVLSGLMIVGGETADLRSVRRGGTLLREGLGLWPDAIVDQHFVARTRNNRLLAAVLDHPGHLGVGIDERTAVIVHGDALRVVGDGTVIVYDARRARVEPTEEGARSAATGLALHVLRAGMQFVHAGEAAARGSREAAPLR
ncbi:MAG: cyanophycinase [Planctomycetota bacterium]|jgi:cyanophycinase